MFMFMFLVAVGALPSLRDERIDRIQVSWVGAGPLGEAPARAPRRPKPVDTSIICFKMYRKN